MSFYFPPSAQPSNAAVGLLILKLRIYSNGKRGEALGLVEGRKNTVADCSSFGSDGLDELRE